MNLLTEILRHLRSVKRTLFPEKPTFRPCTPHLLMAIHKGLDWTREHLSPGGYDYLEFGLYSGFTLWYAQALAHFKGINRMRFFGFDSFKGLPRLEGPDILGRFTEGTLRCPRPLVEKFLSEQGVDWTKTFLIEGDFKQSLKPDAIRRYGIKRCGICVVDCDLYTSAKLALDFLEPLVRSACILILDDFRSIGWAFDEFLEKQSHLSSEPFIEFPHNGRGFILKREWWRRP